MTAEPGPDRWAPLFSSPEAEQAHTAMTLPKPERAAYLASLHEAETAARARLTQAAADAVTARETGSTDADAATDTALDRLMELSDVQSAYTDAVWTAICEASTHQPGDGRQ